MVATTRGTGQGWVLDNLPALSGMDAFHPQIAGFSQEHGYARSDLESAFAEVRSAAMLPTGWAGVGRKLERRAAFCREHCGDAAVNLYMRSSMAYARAQYSYYGDGPRRADFDAAARRRVQALTDLHPTPIERIIVPFEGGEIVALLHLADTDHPAPLVLLIPGRDMVKEEWTHVAQRHFVARGMHALAIERPGYGETLTAGLKLTVDNYERAVSAASDSLA